MKLILTGFRCYENKTFIIPDGEIILLKGPSGIGKSTIFNAIEWTLYGNHKKIYNQQNNKLKCSVYLQMGCFEIKRQKNPELLKLTYNNKNYEDEEAQQIIDSHFGTKEVWKTSSYLPQGECSQLMILSNNEKLDILNALAFSKDESKKIITTLRNHLKLITTDFEQKEAIIEVLTKKIKKYDVNLQEEKDEKTIGEMKEKSIVLKTDLIKLEELNDKYQQQVGIKISLENEMKKLKKEREKIKQEINSNVQFGYSAIDAERKQQIEIFLNKNSNQQIGDNQTQSSEKNQIQIEITIEQINHILSEIDMKIPRLQTEKNQIQDKIKQIIQIKSTIPIIKQIKEIDERLKSSNTENFENINVLEIEQKLNRLKLLQEKRNNGMKLCEEKHLQYKSDIITERIKDLQQVIEVQPQLHKLEELKQKIENFGDIPDTNEIQLNELKSNLLELKKSLNVVLCPSCKHPLRIFGNQLILAEKPPVSEDEINKVSVKMKKTEEGLNRKKEFEILKDQFTQLENSLEDLPSNILSEEKIKKAEREISILQKIEVINEDFTNQIKELENKIKEQSKQVELNNLKEMKTKLMKSIEGIKIDQNIENQEEYEQKYKTLEQEEKHLNEQKHILIEMKQNIEKYSEIEEKLKQLVLTDPSDQISEIETQLNQIEKTIEFNKKIKDFREDQKEIKELEVERDKINKRIANVQELIKLAKEAECVCLRNTVNLINYCMSDVLSSLFDIPISVYLDLDKMSKTTQTTKPGVNFKITYRGTEFDSIDQLSGGERDRISIALTIALSQLSASPILLFDESMSSLDGNLRDLCLNVVREYLKNTKTVIFVNHEAIEGKFDKVIDLENKI